MVHTEYRITFRIHNIGSWSACPRPLAQEEDRWADRRCQLVKQPTYLQGRILSSKKDRMVKSVKFIINMAIPEIDLTIFTASDLYSKFPWLDGSYNSMYPPSKS